MGYAGVYITRTCFRDVMPKHVSNFRQEEVQQEEEELEDKISVDEGETEAERLAREQQEKLEQEEVKNLFIYFERLAKDLQKN